MTWLLFVSLFLAGTTSCKISPALYPSYDVLRPGESVQILGYVTPDGKAIDDKGQLLTDGVVVNQSFLIWVYELKSEIEKLRKGK